MSARDAAALDEVRDAFATLDGPVIVYNKSHSGSRLLARLLAEGGVFMGAQRNASEDALPVFDLVDALVRAHYPDYSRLWSGGAEAREAAELARRSFERHLAGFDRASAGPWGWKLCESAYAMPVFAHLFPRARVIHLVRDGRDVAFCDHRGPDSPFWRKIYFDTDRIATWRGLALTGPAYRRRSHRYNALHWSNAVRVGRAYGSMLGARYLEVRYEDLCTDFAPVAARVLRFAGAPRAADAIERIAPTVRQDSLGKHRRAPARAQREVVGIAKAELLSFGYLERDPERPARSLLDSRLAERVAGRLRGGSRLAPWRRAPKGRGEE
jgi:hypothetical protein